MKNEKNTYFFGNKYILDLDVLVSLALDNLASRHHFLHIPCKVHTFYQIGNIGIHSNQGYLNTDLNIEKLK